MKTIEKILLIGLGSIGKRHLANLQKIRPEIQIFILTSKKDSDFGLGKYVSTLDEALSHKPHAAIVCNPSTVHLQTSMRLVEEGVHVLIEKPLSSSLEGVKSFASYVESNKARVMVAYNLRFRDSLEFFKKIIDNKTYGEVFSVISEVGQYLPDWRPGSDYRVGVSANKNLGGGALLELSHELDYLSWIFGIPVSISSNLMKVTSLEIDVEDYVSSELIFTKGERFIPCHVHLDFIQKKPCRFCKVICSEGELTWDAIKDQVIFHDSKEVLFQGSRNTNDSYIDELNSFIECLEKGIEFKSTLNESVLVMKIIQAIRSSSASGSVVSI